MFHSYIMKFSGLVGRERYKAEEVLEKEFQRIISERDPQGQGVLHWTKIEVPAARHSELGIEQWVNPHSPSVI